MIKRISVTWAKPPSSLTLPKMILNESITVNGYVIPKGFATDGASIPIGARNAFYPMAKGFPAAIAHDHKCIYKPYSRKQADKEFYRDLLDCGVNRGRAYCMYLAVRMYATLAGKK